jgi:hypothetical protein
VVDFSPTPDPGPTYIGVAVRGMAGLVAHLAKEGARCYQAAVILRSALDNRTPLNQTTLEVSPLRPM